MTSPCRFSLLAFLAVIDVCARATAQVAPPPSQPAPGQSPTAEQAPEQAPSQDDASVEPSPNADSAQNNPLDAEMDARLDQTVTRGLAALARMQNPDGSFGESAYGRTVAVTSLACLAFMSDGNLPGRGTYGDTVTKGLEYVLNNSTENGLIATDSANSPMYGHGFATLFLGEVYGMTAGGDSPFADRVHRTLLKAVRLIEGSQNHEGGWRYNPVPFDADTSVTICQIMALRAARNAGLEVSRTVIDRAVEYVRGCQNDRDGGFRYQFSAGQSAWPRSAAGVASLQYAGIYKDRAIDDGLDYLSRVAFPGQGGDDQNMHYFYGHYYAVQAHYLAGGERWAAWWPAIKADLIRAQRPSGEWDDSSAGEAYGTSMALIILQVPKRYLPIFQK
jgi:hypothetical protein